MSNFVPTAEQAAIIAFAADPKGGHGFIRAGAGCGKTTTAIEMLRSVRGNVLMVAFNKTIERELAERAPAHVTVSTMHALGLRAVRKAYGKVQIDEECVFKIFKRKLGEKRVRERLAFFNGVKKLISLAKNTLAWSETELDLLADEFGLDLNGEQKEAVEMAREILDEQTETKNVAVIDFDDMIWLPVAHKLAMPKYNTVVIDEYQDTNACQIELVLGCLEKGGRVFAVGDDRQAIYQFRGADSDAVEKFIERMNATVLPLMTTFRCGKAIVREAQAIVPHFQAGESNTEGVVRESSMERLLSEVRPGDFVLSRTNAPLIAGCMRALSLGMKAHVVGKDFGSTLKTLIKKQKAESIEQLEDRLDAWLEKETARLSKKVPVRESAIEAAKDKVDTILSIASGASSVEAVLTKIDFLFQDTDEKGKITFSSTHRAKGRERDRVFMFVDTFCKPRLDKRTGEWIQPDVAEWNLKYVAITRAKHELVYVKGEMKSHD